MIIYDLNLFIRRFKEDKEKEIQRLRELQEKAADRQVYIIIF